MRKPFRLPRVLAAWNACSVDGYVSPSYYIGTRKKLDKNSYFPEKDEITERESLEERESPEISMPGLLPFGSARSLWP